MVHIEMFQFDATMKQIKIKAEPLDLPPFKVRHSRHEALYLYLKYSLFA